MQFADIDQVRNQFEEELKEGKTTAFKLLKDARLKELMSTLRDKAPRDKKAYGQAINDLKSFLQSCIESSEIDEINIDDNLDVTAPFNINKDTLPNLPSPEGGSIHPISKAQIELTEIFTKMGFEVVESRQIDNEYYMFDSLNFPPRHPAREDFDNFLLREIDRNKKPLLAPAHTSIMQNRILKSRKNQLLNGEPIAVVIPGRVFRNEDVDASHDHMFYQLEGIYVSTNVSVANLIATLKMAISSYFKKDLDIKTNPFYFPFTEPSFEFAISCPFCDQANCKVCSEGYIELLGCGMIHPNVLKMAEIDSKVYTGFAWGLGLNRLAMLNYGIEDIRHFTSGKLEFLRQFKL